MNTDFFFQAILDAAEFEGIELTQTQVDTIQHYASLMADAVGDEE